MKKSEIFSSNLGRDQEDCLPSMQKAAEESSDVVTSSLASTCDTWQHYYPAYEILLDELRDYRFFAPDMLHPSEQAVDYIWEKFRFAAFSPELQDCASQLYSIRQALSHRPLHPESEDYRLFYTQTQQRIEKFAQRFGFIPK